LLFACFTLACLTMGAAPGGPRPDTLSLGPVGAAFEANGQLVLAVAVHNDGQQAVENVTVESIDVKTLSPSLKLPVTLGVIKPYGQKILRATFNDKSGKSSVNSTVTYVIHISVKYKQNGKSRSFQISQSFRPQLKPATQSSKRSSVLPRKVDGGKFKALPVAPPMHQALDDVTPAPLPRGVALEGPRPPTPLSSLSSRETPQPRLERINLGDSMLSQQGRNDPVLFRTQKIVGGPSSFFRPPEPTGATSYSMQSPPLARDVVFAAGNTSAALSLDGGGSFTTIDPTTVFDFRDASGAPIDGNGLCCDQVVDYISSINRYVWVMMTVNRGTRALPIGPNRLRVAVASPQDIVASGGTRWTFFDLTPSTFRWTNSRWFDRPDIAFGDRYLYVSADVIDPSAPDSITARGRVITRIPLADVRDGTLPMSLEFMEPEFSPSADASSVAQFGSDTAFWAAHISDGRVRVYSWPDSSAAASQHDVTIYRWSDADYSSLDPDGRQWLAVKDGRIVAGTRRSGVGLPGDHAREVWFAWTAGRDEIFPQPWVDVLRIDAADFSRIGELPIWNPSYVFAYPSLTVNRDNEVGIAAAWGGAGLNYGNTAVGILGDFVLWITGVSDMSAQVRVRRGMEVITLPTFGDYLTARTHAPDDYLYSGFTYQVKRDPANPGQCEGAIDGCRFEVIFTLFGRQSRIMR
jgi:hypothetical protein